MAIFSITLCHREGPNSPESRAATRSVRISRERELPIDFRVCYVIEGNIDRAQADRASKLLADPVLETVDIQEGIVGVSGSASFFTIMRRPGVMDPVEASIVQTMKDAGLAVTRARMARIYVLAQRFEPAVLRDIATALANEAIEEIHFGAKRFATLSMDAEYRFRRVEVKLRELEDEGLKRVNLAHGLSMNIAELHAVRDFFRSENRDPTDVELEMLAQTWSEHCKHKTMTGPVVYQEAGGGEGVSDSLFELVPDMVAQDGRIRGLLQSSIKRVTDELKRDFCLSVFVDNAGVIAFDEQDAICVKVETHNHPSAIEPYGGAGTGIGGVIRDIYGTGLGAKPICNTDVFCFGPPDMPASEVPKGALHPLRTLMGVVSGVRDYGNRMGIPTINGSMTFDQRYTGNPLVYCGSIGIIPRDKIAKAAQPGDAIVVIGGATGRDGIGGATFSSLELTEESETVSSGAVQIGNAIQEKIVGDVLLAARDLGLYRCVTDCGAGGLSSAVGEMAEHTGALVELRNAPLKYQGLSYREIWLSEAQERMVAAVPQDKLKRFVALCAAEDVQTAVIGTFSDDRRMLVRYDGNEVLNLPMAFLHDGLPRVERRAVWEEPAPSSIPHRPSAAHAPRTAPHSASHGASEALRAILASYTVCSKEWVVRQYDHEVQAMSALKPFCGVYRDGPSDASAIVPKRSSQRAVVVSNGICPRMSDFDPYWMAQAAIDEAVRNAVCAGGDVDRLAILDNFCWGNCDKPDRLGALVRACAGAYVAARGLATPFISGKDSLNNEFRTETGTVAIPHTLLITAVALSELPWLCSMDLKKSGNALYLMGETADEFGGSSYAQCVESGAQIGVSVPRYDPRRALNGYRALNRCQRAGLVRASHDCSDGGLAVALAEMCFAGGLGAEVHLDKVPVNAALNDTARLFSESNARIVIEVAPQHEAALLKEFGAHPIARIGRVTDIRRLVVQGQHGKRVLDEDIEELRAIWKAPLYRVLGEEPSSPML